MTRYTLRNGTIVPDPDGEYVLHEDADDEIWRLEKLCKGLSELYRKRSAQYHGLRRRGRNDR